VLVVFFAVSAAEASVWVSGSMQKNQPGVYGTKGIPDGNNIPGSRTDSVGWIDANDNLWLFGGYGYDDITIGPDCLNDLWKYKIATNQWTWVGGANTVNQTGVYGTMGVPDANNMPGARYQSVSWTDANGNFWLFGGAGYDSSSSGGLNDLWVYDITSNQWAWVKGPNIVDQSGVYGIKGQADPTYVPGARIESASWIDSDGNLWLFGGTGRDSTPSIGRLNDLWKFDGANWTWVSGSSSRNQSGVYGDIGEPNSNNVPGSRMGSVSWIDPDDNLYLFGGYGYDSGGFIEYLNDLWVYDINSNQWTWVKGSSSVGQHGVYGEKGEPNSNNVPGSQYNGISWTGDNGGFWLFGGYGYRSAAGSGYLSDLWRFDGSDWTWVAGWDLVNYVGMYGTKGEPNSANWPGTRRSSVAWKDSSGDLWLFGGYGYDFFFIDPLGYLTDLWRLQDFCARWSPADLNGDCRINFYDLAIMADEWARNYWH
jgi:N-acetylneuraminic acid mutarotase